MAKRLLVKSALLGYLVDFFRAFVSRIALKSTLEILRVPIWWLLVIGFMREC